MIVLVVLLASLVLFRGLGVLGVEVLSSWQGAAVGALAVMFLFTASAHFTKMKKDLVGMVPKALPNPRFLVHLTGVLEVLGAVGLLVPATRELAGLCLALLVVAMSPANVSALILAPLLVVAVNGLSTGAAGLVLTPGGVAVAILSP